MQEEGRKPTPDSIAFKNLFLIFPGAIGQDWFGFPWV